MTGIVHVEDVFDEGFQVLDLSNRRSLPGEIQERTNGVNGHIAADRCDERLENPVEQGW